MERVLEIMKQEEIPYDKEKTFIFDWSVYY